MAAGSQRVAFLQAFQKDRLSTNLFRLRDKEILCDVTLLCSGTIFRAHKIVLAATSEYFSQLLTGDKDYDVITFNSVTPAAMQTLLEFIYSGRVNVASENVFDVLHASHVMAVTEIYDYCSAVLSHRLSLINFRQAWDAADAYSDINLRDAVIGFCLDNLEILKTKRNFLELKLNNIVALLSYGKPTDRSEDAVLNALMAWVCHDLTREKHMIEVLNLINAERVSITTIKNLHKDGLLERFSAINELFSKPATNEEQKSIKIRPMSFRLPPVNALATSITVFVEEAYGKTVTSQYNISDDTWGDVSSVCLPLSNFSVTSYEGVIYIVGGEKESKYKKDFTEFRPEKQRITMLPSMKHARIHAGVCAMNKRIYAVGGFNDDGYLRSVECYEIGLSKWTRLEDISEKKLGVQMTVSNHRLLAIGGWNGDVHVNTVECYDPSVNQWTLMAPLLYGRTFPAVVTINDIVYVLGGSLNGKDAETRSFIQCYYVQEKLWQVHKASMPQQHFCNCACMHKGLVYLLTEDGYVFVFDPRTGEWQDRNCRRVVGWCKHGVLVQKNSR